MTFRTVAPIRKAAAASAPVRVGLRIRNDGSAVVSLLVRRETLDAACKAKTFTVALGDGADLGLVHIAKGSGPDAFAPQEMVNPKTGKPIGIVRFSFQPDGALDAQKRPPVQAAFKIERAGLLVTLPAFACPAGSLAEPSEAPDRQPADVVNGHALAAVPVSPEDEEDEPEGDPEDEAGAELDPAPVAAPPAKKGPGSGKPAVGQLRIDNTLGEESLSFGGKTLELTMRQAKVLAILAKAMPHPVSHAEIVRRAWVGVAPVTALGTLDEIARDMRVPFADMGLVLMSQKGVGMWLHIKGA